MLYVLQLTVGLGGVELEGKDTPNSQDCLRRHELEDWETYQPLASRRRRALEPYL